MLRLTHQRATRSAARTSRLLALLAALALTAAACGGEDESLEIEGAATTEGDEVADDGGGDGPEADEAAAEPDTEGGAEGAEPDGTGDGDDLGDDGARSTINCASVAAPSPGAVIVSPDSNDPASLQVGPGPVTVEVVGCSDTFEANIQYDAFHGQNTTPTLSGFTEGGTLGSWEQFTIEETYWTAGDWTVVVFVNDAETGNRVEYDQVTFTVD